MGSPSASRRRPAWKVDMGRRPPDEPRRAATPLELFRPDQARLAVAALVTFKVLRRERRAAH